MHHLGIQGMTRGEEARGHILHIHYPHPHIHCRMEGTKERNHAVRYSQLQSISSSRSIRPMVISHPIPIPEQISRRCTENSRRRNGLWPNAEQPTSHQMIQITSFSRTPYYLTNKVGSMVVYGGRSTDGLVRRLIDSYFPHKKTVYVCGWMVHGGLKGLLRKRKFELAWFGVVLGILGNLRRFTTLCWNCIRADRNLLVWWASPRISWLLGWFFFLLGSWENISSYVAKGGIFLVRTSQSSVSEWRQVMLNDIWCACPVHTRGTSTSISIRSLCVNIMSTLLHKKLAF